MSAYPVVTEKKMDPSAIQWFHSFQMPDGTDVNGVKPLAIQLQEADLIFSSDLNGKSVLDIGAWDGFFSYEAERRGAKRVLATDHFCWSGPGWGNRDGFDYMHQVRDSKVESLDVDVLALSPETLGTFDVVLFLGVLYHVKDPYSCLEAAARMCSDHLVIETVTALLPEPLPAMRLYRQGELGDDPTNFWAPNHAALEVMLQNFGFSQIEFVASPVSPNHPLNRRPMRSFLRRKKNNGTYRTIIHARR